MHIDKVCFVMLQMKNFINFLKQYKLVKVYPIIIYQHRGVIQEYNRYTNSCTKGLIKTSPFYI